MSDAHTHQKERILTALNGEGPISKTLWDDTVDLCLDKRMTIQDSTALFSRLLMEQEIRKQDMQNTSVTTAFDALRQSNDVEALLFAYLLGRIQDHNAKHSPMKLTQVENSKLRQFAMHFRSQYSTLALFAAADDILDTITTADTEYPVDVASELEAGGYCESSLKDMKAARKAYNAANNQGAADAAKSTLSQDPEEILAQYQSYRPMLEIWSGLTGNNEELININSAIETISFLTSRSDTDPEMNSFAIRALLFRMLTGTRASDQEQYHLMTGSLQQEWKDLKGL